ncbi:MAG: BolA family transcriptional regulator [Gammaproteobacteria bacterium]|nr:BolA family transcriptional regulator [Gammaproteobacteria bacterium]|tara:strand:+ start:8901 stop:9116 length:216 start_codon:yes stop_codon:yes gene_type:complete
MEEIIKTIIEENIPDAVCIFEGDSCNLKLTVTSDSFKELKLLDQHKRVLDLLKSKFQSGELHALSIETKSS